MTEPSDWRPLPGHGEHKEEEAVAASERLAARPGDPAAPGAGSAMQARLAALIAALSALLTFLRSWLMRAWEAVSVRLHDLRTLLLVDKRQARTPPFIADAAPFAARQGEPDRPVEARPPHPDAERPGAVPYGVPAGYPLHPRPELLLPQAGRARSRFRIIWSDPDSDEPWLGRVTAPLWAASDRLERRLHMLRWPEDRRSRIVAASAGLLLGASAVALAASPRGSGTTVALAPAEDPRRVQLEQTIRDYILNHPEIIPEAMERLRARETAKTIAQNRTAIETPFAGAWAGAKDGDVTLIEFSDYSCGFCRASVADIDKLLAEDKRLKVVWREIPILGDRSEQAARLSLSAARQGRFLDFHRLMYASGTPDALSMEKVQKTVGMDPVRTARDIGDPMLQAELDRNVELARTLGISGTPTFIIGDRMLSGAVGYAALKQAIEEARETKG